MKRVRVGLNGFGRIGRAFTRIALERNSFDLVRINTRKNTPELLSYLLKYDSVYRTYSKEISFTDAAVVVEGKAIRASQGSEPSELGWEADQVDIVVDATGAFTTKEELEKHLGETVKKVILTAPSKDEAVPHVVLGVNSQNIDFVANSVISNASCTTNCASPLFKVLQDNLGIVSGMLTTIHAMTMTQSMLDDPLKTKDRSRAAFLNIVPSTSGAAKAVVKTIPELAGKIEVGAIRVPVPSGSLSDITVLVSKPTTAEEVNNLFLSASQSQMQGILGFNKEVLVSSDYLGSSFSCVFDPNYTKVINGNLVKVMGWYDNEWGYSTRLVDLVELIAKTF